MDTTVADPLVGRVLEGRYAVQARIARGGMATVYLAVDQRLDRDVALKVMHADLARDEEFLRRFVREARSAARLSHPNVVAVYDQGEDEGTVFLVMEHVSGRTLRDLLTERGRLTPREALGLLDPVLDALAAAHWNGLIHRDIKPENVLLAEDGRVKVADFGLARAASAATTSEDSKVLLGTVAYLSPEQVERGVADARSDVYATGILLFEMLTGSKPFTGETPLQVAYQHVHSGVPAPSTRVPGLAPELDLLVAQAAARDPDDRPADAGELLLAARRTRATLTPDQLDGVAVVAADRMGQTMVVPVPSGPPAVSAPTGILDLAGAGGEPPAAPVPTRARRERHRGRTVAIVILVLTLLLGVAGWYVGAGPGSKIPTPNVVGHTTADAQHLLQAKHLGSRVSMVFSETVTAGQVAATDPKPGQGVRKHGTVTLDVSKGPERFNVPALKGKTESAAVAALKANNLAEGEVSRSYNDSTQKGRVISSDPLVDSPEPRGTQVSLVISLGPSPEELADWTNKPLTQAQQALKQQHLKVATVEKFNDTVPDGNIIRQDPQASTVHDGDTVTFTVSKGPPLVPVPDVTGMSVADATTLLEKDHFRVKVTSIFPFINGDTVKEQTPSGNRVATKGSLVTIATL